MSKNKSGVVDFNSKPTKIPYVHPVPKGPDNGSGFIVWGRQERKAAVRRAKNMRKRALKLFFKGEGEAPKKFVLTLVPSSPSPAKQNNGPRKSLLNLRECCRTQARIASENNRKANEAARLNRAQKMAEITRTINR